MRISSFDVILFVAVSNYKLSNYIVCCLLLFIYRISAVGYEPLKIKGAAGLSFDKEDVK